MWFKWREDGTAGQWTRGSPWGRLFCGNSGLSLQVLTLGCWSSTMSALRKGSYIPPFVPYLGKPIHSLCMGQFYSFLSWLNFFLGMSSSKVDQTLPNSRSLGMGPKPGLVDVLLSGNGELGAAGTVLVDFKSSRTKECPGELAEKAGHGPRFFCSHPGRRFQPASMAWLQCGWSSPPLRPVGLLKPCPLSFSEISLYLSRLKIMAPPLVTLNNLLW